MNFIDLIVIGSFIVFAISGWRQGFVAALFVFIGFFIGGVLGAFAGTWLAETLSFSGTAALLLVGMVVLVGAIVGQIIASYFGRSLRQHIKVQPFKLFDNVGGLVLNCLLILVITWFVAVTASGMPSSTMAKAVNNSRVMQTLEQVAPAPAKGLYDGFASLLAESGIPSIFDGFGLLLPGAVDPPSPAVVRNTAIQASLDSVVRVSGEAPRCSSGLTGSGFVYAQGRVVTNAHVVAGIPNPLVHVPGQSGVLVSKVVYLDPKVDVAILAVDGLYAKPLSVTTDVSRNDNVVIAGYPGGGNMTATAARVRGVINNRTTNERDVYGDPATVRNIVVLDGLVRPGNSGGPMIDTKGRVAGVVFAQSDDSSNTAFALSIKEVTPAMDYGRRAEQPVANTRCSGQ